VIGKLSGEGRDEQHDLWITLGSRIPPKKRITKELSHHSKARQLHKGTEMAYQ